MIGTGISRRRKMIEVQAFDTMSEVCYPDRLTGSSRVQSGFTWREIRLSEVP